MAKVPDRTQQLLAEGQAALMVTESLLLVLLEAKVLEKQRLVDAIETVIATKRAMMLDGNAPEVSAAAIGILSSIANSLTAADDTPKPVPPAVAQSRRRRG
jgi:hypothetical protein